MATSAIIMTWGQSVAGREHMGLGVFMGGMQFWSVCKQKGEIEDVRVYLAGDGDFRESAGHIVVEGSEAQLNALVAREEYRAILVKALHVVHGLRVSRYMTGDEVPRRIEILQGIRKELGV